MADATPPPERGAMSDELRERIWRARMFCETTYRCNCCGRDFLWPNQRHFKSGMMCRGNLIKAEIVHLDLEAFNDLFTEVDRLRAVVEELKRGEFICKRCGLRNDSERGPEF